MKKRVPIVPTDSVESSILTIRGQKVILDSGLAAIYGVTTKRLNEQVKRNAKRFPPDFVFQLTRAEFVNLRSRPEYPLDNEDELLASNRSQFATGSSRHRDPRLLPYAFTENGAIMAANVLNSAQAVRMSVFVVRAFVRMRELLSGSRELAAELKKLEAKLTNRLDVHEVAITEVLRRIMQLFKSPPIGHPFLNLFTSFRGHALRHDHLRAAALHARPFASVSRRMARENRGQMLGGQQTATAPPAPPTSEKSMGFHTTMKRPSAKPARVPYPPSVYSVCSVVKPARNSPSFVVHASQLTAES